MYLTRKAQRSVEAEAYKEPESIAPKSMWCSDFEATQIAVLPVGLSLLSNCMLKYLSSM